MAANGFPGYEDAALSYQSLGALGALATALAFRMSLYRSAGSPGENEMNSPLNRAYEAQQLTAEWVPLGCVLIIGNLLKVTPDTMGALNLMAFVFAVTRYVFVLRYFLPKKLAKKVHLPIGMVSMITCYIAAFGLAALLFCPL